MGNVSLDISIEALWNTWLLVQRSSRRTVLFDAFAYEIEKHLFVLERELRQQTYRHGPYKTFMVSERKQRLISISSFRDRIVHRLLYEYLVQCFDHTFLYDVWSCRSGKGLLGAVERVQGFARSFPNGYVWRADIRKCFESISHDILLSLLPRRLQDSRALWLAKEIVMSYTARTALGGGSS